MPSTSRILLILSLILVGGAATADQTQQSQSFIAPGDAYGLCPHESGLEVGIGAVCFDLPPGTSRVDIELVEDQNTPTAGYWYFGSGASDEAFTTYLLLQGEGCDGRPCGNFCLGADNVGVPEGATWIRILMNGPLWTNAYPQCVAEQFNVSGTVTLTFR